MKTLFLLVFRRSLKSAAAGKGATLRQREEPLISYLKNKKNNLHTGSHKKDAHFSNLENSSDLLRNDKEGC